MEYGLSSPTLRWMSYFAAEVCQKVLPLDPVDKATVGRVRLDKVLSAARACGFSLIASLISLIHDEPTDSWITELASEKPTVRWVDGKYREHFKSLAGLH